MCSSQFGDGCQTDNLPCIACNGAEITALYLNQFGLTGILDAAVGMLTNLQYLSLEQNLIGGVLPYEIGSLAQLKLLNLRNNSLLRGTLPSSMENLQNLQQIYLDGCAFTGSVPGFGLSYYDSDCYTGSCWCVREKDARMLLSHTLCLL
jgi:hypothetical protein